MTSSPTRTRAFWNVGGFSVATALRSGMPTPVLASTGSNRWFRDRVLTLLPRWRGSNAPRHHLIQICRAVLRLRWTVRQGLSDLLYDSYVAPLAGYLIQPLDYVLHYVIQPLNFTASFFKQPHYGKQRSEKGYPNEAKHLSNGEKKHVKCGY